LNINLCVKLVIKFIFTLIQRVKTALFGKSNSVSFIYRWLMYDIVEHWIVPRQGHFMSVVVECAAFALQ